MCSNGHVSVHIYWYYATMVLIFQKEFEIRLLFQFIEGRIEYPKTAVT